MFNCRPNIHLHNYIPASGILLFNIVLKGGNILAIPSGFINRLNQLQNVAQTKFTLVMSCCNFCRKLVLYLIIVNFERINTLFNSYKRIIFRRNIDR